MFSKVMLGIDDETNRSYAVKVMRKDSLEDMDMARYARREAAVLRKLSHPNIVAFVEAIQSDTKLFLVMEIAPGKELLDVVAAGPLSEADAKVYIMQLVSAIAYLHSRAVVHRDLKPENVLVDQSTRSLKVIDFGLTGVIRKNAVMATSCGSSYYSAPEVTYANGDGYDGIKADAWSLGILSYIILTGSHPFIDANGDLMVALMRQGTVEYPETLSRGAIHFISRLLTIDPRKRYSVAQVSLHPWLTGRPVPSVAHTHGADLKDRPKKEYEGAEMGSRFIVKRPGTFSGASHHKILFGRNDRNNQSSPLLAVRRRSGNRQGSGNFLWFRRGNASQESAMDRDDSSPQKSNPIGYRRGSLDRARGLIREGRITIDIMGRNQGNGADSMDGEPRVRRQLSLSGRTRALLMRNSNAQEQANR